MSLGIPTNIAVGALGIGVELDPEFVSGGVSQSVAS